jgi:phosphoenolpyruvate carboxykinase (ATP)
LLISARVRGPYGIGKRICIRYTRALLDAALDGSLHGVEYRKDPVFGFEVPNTCPGVPDSVMDPASSWPDKAAYTSRYRSLATRFVENFKRFEGGCAPEVIAAGPKL